MAILEARVRVAAQGATHRQPVDTGHVDVEDHRVEAFVPGRLERRIAAVDGLDAVARASSEAVTSSRISDESSTARTRPRL